MELLCSPEDASAHLAPEDPHLPLPSPTFVTFYCVTFFMALIIREVLYMCHDRLIATPPHWSVSFLKAGSLSTLFPVPVVWISESIC